MLNALIGGNNYLMWMIPGVILTIYAQFRLKRKFGKYSKIENAAQITGKDTSRKILNSEDLQKVPIKSIRGKLTDHYDPRTKTVNLSQPIYGKTSIGAMGVAAHETGHAIQDENGYIWMRIRGWIVPFASIGTNLGYVLILAGLVIGWQGVARIGVLLFLLTTLFALITLPVEFNASKRAKKKLQELGLTEEGEEDKAVDDVLDAAAFTYVASFATSAIQGFYWWLTVRKEFHDEEDIGEVTPQSLIPSMSGATSGGALSNSSAKSKDDKGRGGTVATAAAAATTAKLLSDATSKDEEEDKKSKEHKTLAGTAATAAGKSLIGGNDDDADADSKSKTLGSAAAGAAGKALINGGDKDESETKSKTLAGTAAGAAGKTLLGSTSADDSSEATHESRRSNETDDDDSDEKGGGHPN